MSCQLAQLVVFVVFCFVFSLRKVCRVSSLERDGGCAERERERKRYGWRDEQPL